MGNVEKFDSIAEQYDSIGRIEIAKIIANAIRSRIIDGANKTAIDYGCGTGLIGLELIDEFHSMVFIDASSNMIEQVKQKIKNLTIQNASTLTYNSEEERPLDLRADYIILAQTLLHIKEIEPFLSLLFNLLKKEGHLFIIDFNKNADVVSDEIHNGFEQSALCNTLKKIGFTKTESQTFFHGEKMLTNKDASLFIVDAVKSV